MKMITDLTFEGLKCLFTYENPLTDSVDSRFNQNKALIDGLSTPVSKMVIDI